MSEKMIPSFETIDIPLTVTSNSGQVTGNVVTLPYTNTVLAKQPMSSRVTNINPFSVFSWKGDMNLVPNSDTWVEVVDLPPNYTSSVEFVSVPRPTRAFLTSSWSSNSFLNGRFSSGSNNN